MNVDRVIIGAGIYGLYAATYSVQQGHTVLIIEYEDAPFTRASYVNQARLHMGYHYPRSYSTAKKTAGYFDHFANEFKESINNEFDQIYATSAKNSYTNKQQFIEFCKSVGIRCDNIDPGLYFQSKMCDGAYLTKEYAFDAQDIKTRMINNLNANNNVQIHFNTKIKSIKKQADEYIITTTQNEQITTKYILAATYASTNQIQMIAGHKPFDIKYELCELILCKVSDDLKNTGITVMDGLFFSLMPFGNTGCHTLSSVEYSPHMTSTHTLPTFDCQQKSNGYCTPETLGNCNTCPAKPKTAWHNMSQLAQSYLKPQFKIEYIDSLFSMKPTLKTSEKDDSRPTLIKKFTENPTFINILSGKINTIYDMDEVLK